MRFNVSNWKQYVALSLAAVWGVDQFLLTHHDISAFLHVSDSVLASITMGLALISESILGYNIETSASTDTKKE